MGCLGLLHTTSKFATSLNYQLKKFKKFMKCSLMDTCCLGLQSLLAVSLYSTCPIFALPSRNIHSFMVFRRKLVWNKSEFQMELLFKASNTNKCLFPNHWRQGTIYVVSVKIFEKMLRTSLNNNSGVLIKTNCFCDDKAKRVGDETRRGRDKNVFLLPIQSYFIKKAKRVGEMKVWQTRCAHTKPFHTKAK